MILMEKDREDIVNAITQQANQLIHPCIGVGYYDQVITLAEKLTLLLQPVDYSVFFTQSGSEAIETAIKLATYVQNKYRIVAFKGGFHGRTLGALSLTTSKTKYRAGYEPFLYPVSFLDYPNLYHTDLSIDDMVDTIIKTPHLNDQVAAVIIEPILGEGGYYMAPPEVLLALQKRCQELNIYLIFDEIQSGIGRTGAWFSFQHYDLSPDIITTAKGLGSGMPIAACIAKKEIMDQWTAGAHGGTYGGNPVACAAALATLSVIETQLTQIHLLGEYALSFLNEQLGTHPYVGDIRGLGLMIGIEFVTDKKTKTPYPDFMKKVMSYCLERQLIIISCGIYDNVIRIIPPLVIDKRTLLSGLRIFVEGVHSGDH